MKNGKAYAPKVKRLCARLKRTHGMPQPVEPADPIDQLLLGILHRGTTVSKTEQALARIRSAMVDLNELRVSTPSELVELLGPGFPHATEKAKTIVKALSQVFDHFHALNLDALKTKGKREARRFVEELDGVDSVTAAEVVLLALEGHAFPIDEITHTVLREEGLVHPDASVDEVQAFFERNVSASKARGYAVLLRRYGEERIKRMAASRGGASRSAKRQAAVKKKAGGGTRKSTKKTSARAGSRRTTSARGASKRSTRSAKAKKPSSAAGKRRAAPRKGRSKPRSAPKSR